MIRKLILIFILAFLLNFIWENFHALLYDNYMGGKITEFILIRASLADAIIITIISSPFIFFSRFKKYDITIIPIGLAISILHEIYALSMDRWVYNTFMPIIPFINVGLTPTIQIGLLGYVSYKISESMK